MKGGGLAAAIGEGLKRGFHSWLKGTPKPAEEEHRSQIARLRTTKTTHLTKNDLPHRSWSSIFGPSACSFCEPWRSSVV